MTIDDAIILYSRQSDIVEYAVSQNVPKGSIVKLFDLLDKLSDRKSKSLISEIERVIVEIAEFNFDEKLNSLLLDIKREVKGLYSTSNG